MTAESKLAPMRASVRLSEWISKNCFGEALIAVLLQKAVEEDLVLGSAS